jgi:hypothetical protein
MFITDFTSRWSVVEEEYWMCLEKKVNGREK